MSLTRLLAIAPILLPLPARAEHELGPATQYEWTAPLPPYMPPPLHPHRKRARVAAKVFAGFNHTELLGRAFNGLAVDGSVGATRNPTAPVFDFFGGLGYAYGRSASGLSLQEIVMRGGFQYRTSSIAIGAGPRFAAFFVGNSVATSTVVTLGPEVWSGIEAIKIDAHSVFIEARGSMNVLWRWFDVGPLSYVFTLGCGYRY